MNTLHQTMTRRPSVAESFAAVTDRLGVFPKSVVELALRAGVAAVFFKSGLSKIANWELTVQLFTDEYAVPVLPPELAAYMATAAELICPVLLLAGLAARLGALALLGVTAVIQIFVYPQSWAEHLLWASIFVYVLTQGPGKLSVDHAIRRYFVGSDR
ncbi:MAG: DoxX family protein [Gammaproteobacteria bacterium]|nr:DoxX family protein [Gammaproteobacteria bacterium]